MGKSIPDSSRAWGRATPQLSPLGVSERIDHVRRTLGLRQTHPSRTNDGSTMGGHPRERHVLRQAQIGVIVNSQRLGGSGAHPIAVV